MGFVADDFVGWLIALFADAGRKKLAEKLTILPVIRQFQARHGIEAPSG